MSTNQGQADKFGKTTAITGYEMEGPCVVVGVRLETERTVKVRHIGAGCGI